MAAGLFAVTAQAGNDQFLRVLNIAARNAKLLEQSAKEVHAPVTHTLIDALLSPLSITSSVVPGRLPEMRSDRAEGHIQLRNRNASNGFCLLINQAESAMSKKAEPEFVAPMMASSAQEPFDDPDWIFETKLDGYRFL